MGPGQEIPTGALAREDAKRADAGAPVSDRATGAEVRARGLRGMGGLAGGWHGALGRGAWLSA